MARIILLTNRDSVTSFLYEAYGRVKEECAHMASFQITGESIEQPEWQSGKNARASFQTHADLAIISWMGSAQDDYVQDSIRLLCHAKTPYVMVGTRPGEATLFNFMEKRQAERIRDFLLYGGAGNMDNLVRFAAHEFCAVDVTFSEPQPIPWCGIYYPGEEAVLSVEEYRHKYYDPNKTTVGVLFPRDAWLSSDRDPYDRLIASLLKNNVNALPVFSHWTRDDELNIQGSEDAVIRHFVWDGSTAVDAVINLMWFSLTVGRPLYDGNYLVRLNVPVIQGETLMSEPASWAVSEIGLTPVELVSNVVMPEFDGVVHGVPFAGRVKNKFTGSLTFHSIPERIHMLANRACKWAILHRKANKEKKIAIIFHNYPPSDATIGTAIGLDSPLSVEWIIRSLQEAGYDVGGDLPENGYWLLNQLVEQVTNDRTFLSEEKAVRARHRLKKSAYEQYFLTLPQTVQAAMREKWGDPPGDVFCYDGDLLIPGLQLGNIFVGVQPPRGFGEKPSEVYHSSALPPTHHYLAYYQWLRTVFEADAVVHVGTHGSLEWLPGKGAGLSETCYPSVAIGDLPNIYPYLITIVCEGIQAKRRANACLIGHLPPPVSDAETYDELAALEILVDDYRHYECAQPDKLSAAQAFIREKVAEIHLDTELPAIEGETFDVYLSRIHGYINEIKDMNVRVGLHILGKQPEENELREYLLAMTRVDNDAIPSLRRVVAEMMGYDYDTLCSDRGGESNGVLHATVLDAVRANSRTVIQALDACGYDLHQMSLQFDWMNACNENTAARLMQVCNYICGHLVVQLEKTRQELTNTIRALDGEYIEPGPAGAPTSGMADVLPTGRNFFGVDPRAIPSRLAWEEGKELGDALLQSYLDDEGQYPERIGMIFWSGNNMRTKGQCVAEFLYLLGVQPVWQGSSGRVSGLSVIPLEKLERPRIDVTARISGMFRDSLPPAVDLLDEAVNLVADLDESPEMNYVKKHALEEAALLEEQGCNAEEAKEKSRYRVFCCRPGTYGAGVGLVLENKNWSSLDDLAAVYVNWGGYAYTRQKQGVFAPESLKRQLATLDATVKNEDNYEVNMLDSDDFNAFHGGMIAAVRALKGAAPRSYCGDSSDAGQIRVRSLEAETKRLYRSEVLNPKFIEGMKKHGYKGAADLSSVVSHSCEWSATSNVIDDWMYDELANKYALDSAMQDWMKEVNPWALKRIADKLLESASRGLWQADADTIKALQRLYLSVEGDLEERSDE